MPQEKVKITCYNRSRREGVSERESVKSWKEAPLRSTKDPWTPKKTEAACSRTSERHYVGRDKRETEMNKCPLEEATDNRCEAVRPCPRRRKGWERGFT